MSARADTARARLEAIVASHGRPEYRAQLLDAWLQVATAAEQRRAPRRVGALLGARYRAAHGIRL